MPETAFEGALRVAKLNGATDQLTNQDDQIFLFSILKVLSRCPQSQWDQLAGDCPPAAQWYQEACDANNVNKPIPKPVGFVSKRVSVVPTPPKALKLKGIESGRIQSATANKSNVPQALELPRKTKEQRSKNAGILDAIRKTVILHQDWNAKKIHEHLTQNGFSTTTLPIVAVNVGDIKRVIGVARELGYWRDVSAPQTVQVIQTNPTAA